MAEGRGLLTIRLNQQLGTLVSSVKIGIQNNLSLFNIVSETTLAELLNRIHGWALVNANSIRQNYPGIDLIDPERGIAVQVTSTRSVDKVRNTLEKTGKLDDEFKKLVILVITHEPPTREMKHCALPGNVKHMDIWSISDVLRDALALSVEKLTEITGFLEQELGSVTAKVEHLQHLELPPRSALPPSGFVGREEELAELRRRFDSGDKEVYLTGLGGMGKTELAIHYGQNHRGAVHLVRFDTSFRRTLANMALGIRPRLHEEELRLEEGILIKKVMNLLEHSGGQDLLILDNVDSDEKTLAQLQEDPCFDALKKLPLRLLMTTRSDPDRAIRVDPMPDGPLFKIFENHGAKLDRPEMAALIKAVNGHTLTIDLIARTLNGKGWRKVTAERMLTALQKNDLKEQKYQKIATDYNQSKEQAQIYQHLSAVFDVSGISAVCRRVMGYATLLPEAGMDGECFGMSLPEEEQDALDTLLERGWLEMKSGLLTIHPVIRLVCRTEQPLTADACEAFLDRLWEQYDRTQYRPDHYSQMAELFALAHDRLGRHHGRWLNRSGILLNELAQDQKLHDLYHTRLSQLEGTLPPNDIELATAYNYYGISLRALGRYSAALSYGQKALVIQQEVLPEDHVELAYSYNNVGNAHSSLGDYHKALKYQLKALEILRKVLPPEHPDPATSYNNVGSTYGELGNHHKALEYQQIALDIRRKVLSPEHPLLAASYNNVGNTYGELGNHHKALEYKQIALNILKKALPPEHPDLAISYNSMGYTYGKLGNHHKALECELKALTIREQSLPPEHPDLALSCNNIAWTYQELGDLIQAAQYMRRAADIIGRSDLPKTHPDRINYPKWAAEFEKKAEMQRRLLSQFPAWNNPFPFGTK